MVKYMLFDDYSNEVSGPVHPFSKNRLVLIVLHIAARLQIVPPVQYEIIFCIDVKVLFLFKCYEYVYVKKYLTI